MKENKPFNPSDISLFSPYGIMLQAYLVSDLIKKLYRLFFITEAI